MSYDYIPRRITVAEMAPHVHSFGIGESKANKISDWLKEWITGSLEKGTIKPNDFLPLKGDLAFHIGVSIGTIQNAFRILEDSGYVESKQKIGTYIKTNDSGEQVEKLTSKREMAVEVIKQYILDQGYQKGARLNSTREISCITQIPLSTVRIAINTLIQEKILVKEKKSFVVINTNFDVKKVESETLVAKVAAKIHQYVAEKADRSGKLPSNNKFADMYNVSVKTVYDAVKLLVKEGFLITRRGRYGTSIVEASTGKNSLYDYEKVELKIKSYISKECEIGSKLPTMRTLSKEFNVSTKTIKKALNNLSEDGYVAFSRGRNGGTYVTDIPQGVNEAYTWLALNPEYIKETEN